MLTRITPLLCMTGLIAVPIVNSSGAIPVDISGDVGRGLVGRLSP